MEDQEELDNDPMRQGSDEDLNPYEVDQRMHSDGNLKLLGRKGVSLLVFLSLAFALTAVLSGAVLWLKLSNDDLQANPVKLQDDPWVREGPPPDEPWDRPLPPEDDPADFPKPVDTAEPSDTAEPEAP